MKQILALLLVLLLLLPILLPASTAGVVPPESRVTVEHSGNRVVTVRYELSQPAREMHFAANEPVIRADYWRVEPPLEISGDRIAAATPFTEATATLLPNDRALDRIYASLVTFDEATSIVNLDYVRLAGESAPITIVNAYDAERGTCAAAYEISLATDSDERPTIGRYVLVSASLEECLALLATGDGRLFFSSEVPQPVAEAISSSVTPVYEGLRSAFGVAPEHEPLVFVTHDAAAGQGTFQADVGWRSFISLRLYGAAWSRGNGDLSGGVVPLLAHELVHLWLGKLIRADDGDGLGHAWLHEGAAEYVAMLTLLQHGSLSGEAFRDALGSRISACSRDLGSRALRTERQPALGTVLYHCGVLVQFVYDLEARSASGGRRSIVDLWRSILENAGQAGRSTFRTADFIEAYPEASRNLAGVLSGPEPDPQQLTAWLRSHGVETATRDPEDVGPWAAAILFPLLRANCKEAPFGFYTQSDHLELDANDTCRGLPGGLIVRHVAGVDVIEHPADAYDAAAASCASEGSLRLSGRTPAEPELILSCSTLDRRPMDIEILTIPFLDSP